MAAIRPDGLGVELPMGRRPRGRTITDARACRLRDLVAVILHRGVGLSVPDTLAVLSKGALAESSLWERLRKCPIPVQEAVALLRSESFEDDHAA